MKENVWSFDGRDIGKLFCCREAWTHREDPDRTQHCIEAELWYPRTAGDSPAAVIVSLCDVRAADDLLIEYDFERDGWSILQGSRFQWDESDGVCSNDWQEVAFVEAWAREEDDD